MLNGDLGFMTEKKRYLSIFWGMLGGGGGGGGTRGDVTLGGLLSKR